MKIVNEKKLQSEIDWSPYWPKRHEPQIQVVECPAREIAIDAGRGFGKSAVAAYLAFRTLLTDDKEIIVTSPTYDLTQRVFEYLERWLARGFPHLLSGIEKRPFPQIKTPWHSNLVCKSAENPVGILGKRYDLNIVDEASRIRKNVYDTYIFPTSSAGGKTIFISTPFGKNWFYDRYLKAKEQGGAFKFESRANPYFLKEEWERAKSNLPEQVFKQEYMAEFLDDAASVFRGIRNIIISEEEVNKAELQRRKDSKEEHPHFFSMGVDLGKYESFTVITVIDRANYYVVHQDRFKSINWPLQKERIRETAKKWNNARITIDSTGLGDPITDDLKRMGLAVDDFRYTNKSKQQLIDKLSIFIEQKRIRYPDIPVLIDELESFGYILTDSGKVRYSAPEGLYDDCVNSLALAVWPLSENPITGPVEPIIFKHTKY